MARVLVLGTIGDRGHPLIAAGGSSVYCMRQPLRRDAVPGSV